MDRRTILAILLSLLIYYGWLILKGPPEMAEQPQEVATQPVTPAPEAAPVPQAAPAPAQEFPEQILSFQACDAQGEWSSRGGVLRDLVLLEHEEPYEVTPLWSWLGGTILGTQDGPWKPYGEAPGPARLLTADALALSAGSGPLDAPLLSMEVLEREPGRVVFRGVTRDQLEITKTVTGRSELPCVLEVEVAWRNLGTAPFQGDVWLGVHDDVPPSSGGMLARYSSITQVVSRVGGSVYYGDLDSVERPELQEGDVSWFGIANRYFGMVVLPAVELSGSAWLSPRTVGNTTLYGHHYTLDLPNLAPGAVEQASFQVYLGPLDTDVLGAVQSDLTDLVDFGWFAVFAHPLLWLLKLFYAGVGNWGVAIMLLTLLVKMMFFPLTQKAFKSGQAMQAIQPKLQELRETYKDNQEELNRRMMELFRENEVNPFGGCLPMLVQFPVWIALYNVLLSSVELYHTEFLYLRDLSSPDPYGVLPFVVVVLMMVQQSLMPTGNMDPAQARMMRLMPLLFGFFFFTFPSGLVVYIFVNMVLSILQQWLIRRSFQPVTEGAPA